MLLIRAEIFIFHLGEAAVLPSAECVCVSTSSREDLLGILGYPCEVDGRRILVSRKDEALTLALIPQMPLPNREIERLGRLARSLDFTYSSNSVDRGRAG